MRPEEPLEEPERWVRPQRRLPRAVRERQILDAAVVVFSRQGFHDASMDEISEVAGVSKPMIYAYLGSKDDLFAACIRREAARMMAAIAERVDPSLPRETQLWRGLLAFFDFVADNRDGWRVLHRQSIAQGAAFGHELTAIRAQAVETVADLLVLGTGGEELAQTVRMDEREARGLAAALVGAAESLADWWSHRPDEPAASVAGKLMNLVWMGFGDLVDGRVWRPPSSP
jgi:AcrR family transcriptional regulator